jgi:thiol-disulfide isomerase/thioredoxin
MGRLFLVLGVCAASVLFFHSQADAQADSKAIPGSEASEPAMVVIAACPIVSGPGKNTKELEIDYYPSRPAAAIKDPRSLTLRLAFDNPYTRDKDRTVAFERQKNGGWKAIVPLAWQNYAIWYVRDDSIGQRDDNNGQYWDLVFCDETGKKLSEGIRHQAEGYAGAIFSDDLKRPTDYEHAIAILEANINRGDERSELLVYDEWVFKFRLRSDRKSAMPDLVQEIEKGLSQHADEVGYVHGTAEFLVNWEQAFPPALVEKAAALADRVVPRSRMASDLGRERAEHLKDPQARAQALGEWLARHPDDPVYGNYVRKERLEIFGNLLGDVGTAEDSFQDLAQRTPRDADVYATMATAYIRGAAIGRRVNLDQALTLLDKAEANLEAVELDSGLSYVVTLYGDIDQKRAILNFWRGRALLEQQKWKEAESFLGRSAPVLHESRPAWQAYVFLGRTQEQQQEWAKAKNSYLEAALRSPGSIETFVELSLKTGTPSREAALTELAGAQKRNFDAAHYKPALVDLPVPDFTFTIATGGKITTSSLHGQTVVLDLWATWCGPCVSELGGFAKLRQAHPELRLLLAAMDSTIPEIEKEFRQNGLSSEDIVLVDDPNAAKFGLGGVPQTFVIDKNGRIRIVHYGALPDVVSFMESDLIALGSAAIR